MGQGVSAQSQARTSILLVSTDTGLAQSLRKQLDQYHYVVVVCTDAPTALVSLQQATPTVILIDGNGPTLQYLRGKPGTRQIPIVAMYPPGTDCDVECVPALEDGIDLTICKPVGTREVIARLRAIIRRQRFKGLPKSHFSVGDLSLDIEQHEVTLHGRVVPLTIKEFKILHELIQQPNRVFTRDELLNLVWGEDVALGEHNLDVHVHSLRRKIEAHPTRPTLIVTVRGVGYKLKTD